MQLSSISKPSLAQQSTSKEHSCVSHCFPDVLFFFKQWNVLGMKSEFLKVTGTSRISCLKLNYPSEQRARDGFACWVHLTFITWKLCAFKASGLAIWGLQRLKYPRFQTMSAGFGQKSLSDLAYSEYPSEDSDTELTSMAHAHTHQNQRHPSSTSSVAKGLKMNQICCLKTPKNTNIHQPAGYVWHWRPRRTRCRLVIQQVSNGKVQSAINHERFAHDTVWLYSSCSVIVNQAKNNN